MVHLSLDWESDLKFKNSEGSPEIRLHSSTPGVTSPTQALAYAVMGCMGMDVVHVIEKSRQSLSGLVVRFEGERAAEEPRRFLSMRLHFVVTGRVEPAIVGRAIDLSKTKYCSVWHTIRPDVQLSTTFEVLTPDGA